MKLRPGIGRRKKLPRKQLKVLCDRQGVDKKVTDKSKDQALSGKRNESEEVEKPKGILERIKKNKPSAPGKKPVKKEEEKHVPIKAEGARVINLRETNNNLRKKPKAESQPEQQSEPDKAYSQKARCRYWPACTKNEDCEYWHPTEMVMAGISLVSELSELQVRGQVLVHPPADCVQVRDALHQDELLLHPSPAVPHGLLHELLQPHGLYELQDAAP